MGQDSERKLSIDQICQFKEAWDVYDPRQGGTVSTKQLGPLMRHIGFNPTQDELQDLVMMVDHSCTGLLTFPDFLDMMNKIIGTRNQESEVEDAFRCFDRKGEGMVTRQELSFIFQNLGGGVQLMEEEIEALLTEVDTDGDGVINCEEFFGLAANLV